MTNTANSIPVMLDLLKEYGWTCRFPTKRHQLVIDGKPVPCVHVTGDLWHFRDAEVFLSEDGRVFLCHELHRVHPTDIDLQEFLRWLQSLEPVWNTPAKKVLPGQKSLFGDDE